MKKLVLFLFLLVWVVSGVAQVVKKDLANRKYEPVVISMKDFTGFYDKLVKNLFLYAYDDTTQNWRPVPFQIDDRDSRGNYNFGVPADTPDEYDELVFMLKDMGDRVPDGYWLTDSVSRNLSRYEIEIEDTLWHHQKAWVYLFYSNTISNFTAEDYINYDVTNDSLYSKYYEVEFSPQFGLPWHYRITHAGGGSGIDILDRLKLRVKIHIDIYGDIVINEDNIHKQEILSIDSHVRVIRNMMSKISVATGIPGYDPVEEDSIFMPIAFYPYNLNLHSDNIDLALGEIIPGIEARITLIRTSMDLNANANGMKFYNKYNKYEPEDVQNMNLINGMGHSNIQYHTLDVPGLNWFLITGTPVSGESVGSIFSTTFVPDLGNARNVYFYDYNYSKGQTWDGTSDTGDRVSWGDSGIRIDGNDITGKFKMLSNTFFLPANQVADFGDTLNANLEQPVLVKIAPQNFDLIAPAKIDDLAAISAYDTTVTLTWTAPGDDSTAGTASYYEVRYSMQAPTEGAENDWFENLADTLAGEPDSSLAGTKETMIVSGLQPGQTYYFAVRTFDEADVNDGAGNGSPVSNIVSTVTLDVELAAFSAVATGNSVLLSWRTVGEDNNLGFELQRKNAGENYEIIAFISGNGTTSAPQDYSYQDNNLISGIYYYRIKQIDTDGSFRFFSEKMVDVAVPAKFALYQNYPNPFNPTTTISYDLAKDSRVRLGVFNVKGQIMQVLVNGSQPAGRYKETISASQWPSGIYFVRLVAGNRIFVKKIILLE